MYTEDESEEWCPVADWVRLAKYVDMRSAYVVVREG